jgi:hypothetical protein
MKRKQDFGVGRGFSGISIRRNASLDQGGESNDLSGKDKRESINRMNGGETHRRERFPLGVVVISVVMFFAGLGTAFYWLLRLAGRPVACTLPVGPEVYRAFIFPDIVLSVLLFTGSYGLLKLRRSGFMISFAALGMWLSDLLLTFGLTGWSRIGFLGPCLLFILFASAYLWKKRVLFH